MQRFRHRVPKCQLPQLQPLCQNILAILSRPNINVKTSNDNLKKRKPIVFVLQFFRSLYSYFDDDEKPGNSGKEYQPLSSESSESEDELDAYMSNIEVKLRKIFSKKLRC